MRTCGSIGFLMVLGACLCGASLNAQETQHGGFGGPAIKFTEVDGSFGVLVGGRGGWVINGSVMIGGGGYALANTSNFDDLTNAAGNPGTLEMGYGGLEVGYAYRSEERVHLAVGVLIGAGGLTWNPDDESVASAEDAVFIAEPEVNVVFKATPSFRIAVGSSYRITRDVELLALEGGDLSGFAGVVTLKFGRF